MVPISAALYTLSSIMTVLTGMRAYFRYSTNEFYKELKQDLQILKSLGIEVLSVTYDGKKSIIRTVRKVYEQDIPNSLAISLCFIPSKT